MSFIKPSVLAVCAVVALAIAVTVVAAANAQSRPRAVMQSSSNLELTRSCEQTCRRSAGQRACVSACYRDNYKLQRTRAASRADAIKEIDDWAYEEDIRANPYLSQAAKNEILQQSRNDFPDFRRPSEAGTNPIGGANEEAVDEGPLGIAPIRLARLYYNSGITTYNKPCPAYAACQLPKLYDVPPDWFTISYALMGISADEVDTYLNSENLKRFEFIINDTQLTKGQSVIHGNDFIVFAEQGPCDYPGAQAGEDCLFFSISPAIFFAAAPNYSNWTLELKFYVDKPQIGPLNPAAPVTRPNIRLRPKSLFKTSAPGDPQPSQSQNRAAGPVQSQTELTPLDPGFPPRDDFTIRSYITPPDYINSYWAATIGKTVSSERCMSCHAMDTQAKIFDHHQNMSVSTIEMVPSALISGQQIHSCSNCHRCGPDNCPGFGGFDENRWATPTQAQNINWAGFINANPQNWPAGVCQRMKSNLVTPQLREEHFHEDFRLFWAVADGNVVGPGGGPLPTAPPNSYTAFIDRFDRWNLAGAPCPPG